MLISLTTFLAALSWIFRSRAALQLENLALRHQIGVLQRSAVKRPKLTPVDRLLWICLSRLWRDWRSALLDVEGAARPTRTTAHFAPGPRSDRVRDLQVELKPPDVPPSNLQTRH